jgi:dipeptidyl aminopeptidase/acylaminoacyl peptidase
VSGGWDPVRDAEKFHPFMPVKNVTKDFPPTLLIHGMKDTDVPVENSFQMEAVFKEHSVEHRLITDPEADHGSNWSEEARAGINRAALEFVLSHW